MTFTPENVDQYATLNPGNKNLLTIDAKDVYEMPLFKISKQFSAGIGVQAEQNKNGEKNASVKLEIKGTI